MYRRSTVICLGMLLLSSTLGPLRADQGEPAPESESLWVTSIARLGTSDRFVAATADGLLLREANVYSFKSDDPSKLTKLYTHPAAVWCLAATSGGGRIASVDYRGNLVVYDTDLSQPRLYEKALERWCQSLVISPDDRFVVAGNEAGKVMSFEMSGGRITKSVELDGHAVTGLAISPDGTQLAATDGGGHVHLLKWPDLESLGKIEINAESAWCVAYVDKGSHLLVGSADRHLYRCEAKPDAKAEVVAKGTDWITQLAVSPSGQVAAAEVGGRLHFPTTGGTDSMDAKSGVWALCWNDDAQLFAGTRKDGVAIAGRSWKWTEPKPEIAEPEAKAAAEEVKPEPTAETPAAETPAAETPAAETPAAETPAANEKHAEEKPAEETPAAATPGDQDAGNKNESPDE